MSGQGAGNSPNVAFKAVSARLHDQELTGLSSSLTELQQLLDSRNDREFTAAVDRRCRSLEGMGLCKPDKVTLNDVPSFKHGDDLVKWAEQLFNPILQHQGGSDGDSGEVKIERDVCLDEAIDGHCTDERCWRKHDAESIEQYKAALGAECGGPNPPGTQIPKGI